MNSSCTNPSRREEWDLTEMGTTFQSCVPLNQQMLHLASAIYIYIPWATTPLALSSPVLA